MASISNLAVSFNARTKGFERAMRRLERRLKSSRRAIRLMSIAASAVAGGGMGLLVANAFRVVDTQAKVADKLGATTEELIGLQHAANLAGIATKTFNMGTQRLVRRMAEAAMGTGEAKDALKTLGINAKELSQQPLSERLFAVANALSKVSDSGNQVRLAFKLFDSEGVVMLNLMQNGAQAMREAMKEAEDLGLVINRIDAAKVEIANDEFTKMRGFLQAIFKHIAVQLAPAIFNLVKMFVSWAKESGGASQIVADGLVWVTDVTVRAIEVFKSLKAVVFGVASVFGTFVAGVMRFVDFAQSGGPVGMLIRGLFGVDFDPLKFASGFDLSAMADSIEGAADKAWEKAGQLLDDVGTGAVSGEIKNLFSGIGSDIDQAVMDKLNKPLPAGELAKAASKRVAQFKQISLSRTAFGVPGASSKEQKVNDPQLEQTNALLRTVATNTGRTSGLAFT